MRTPKPAHRYDIKLGTVLTYPPSDGSLLFSDALDFRVKHDPTATFFVFTKSETDHSLEHISTLEFSRAVHRTAYRLRPLNCSIQAGQVVGILAITDTLVYQTVFMGLIQAGLVPFPISPRLSPAAIASLLERSGSTHLIASQSSLGSLVQEVCSIHPVKVIDAPSLGDVYPFFGRECAQDSFVAYPVQKRGADESLFFLHSSGSTGLPHPIHHTNLSATLWVGLPFLDGMKPLSPQARFGGMPLPPFHAVGLQIHLFIPLYICRSVALYPPTFSAGLSSSPITPSPANFLKYITLTRSTAVVAPPTTAQAWSLESSSIELLKTLEWVAIGGGPLDRETGNYLWSQGVNLRILYGASEIGGVGATPLDLSSLGSSRLPNGEVAGPWSFLHFGPSTSPKWIPQGDNTFELILQKCPSHIPVVLNYGDEEGYSTSDIFTPHATAPDLWYFIGRRDDVIVHSTGEKTVPSLFEDIIIASPYATEAVMFGEGRDHAGILIELREGVQEPPEEIRERLWPVISKANSVVATFSRVFKEMILFTTPKKPLPRTEKGALARKAALRIYQDEIDGLYRSLSTPFKSTSSITPPTLADLKDVSCVQAWISAHIKEIEPNLKVNSTENLFEHGFDSLSAVLLSNRIGLALATARTPVTNQLTQSMIYEYPSPQKLAEHISSLFSPSLVAPAQPQSGLVVQMLAKYSLPPHQPKQETILLTGSTGALGSNILARLLQDPRVQRVWAMNRSGGREVIEKQTAAFLDQGLNTELLNTDKVNFVKGDLASPGFGLDKSVLNELKGAVTSIIHNAWMLNFNLPLASFEPLVAGTTHLVEFARLCNAKMFFVSSIAAVQSWADSKEAVPEAVITNPDVAIGGGYGASKYICERILADSGVPGCSFRLGQVAGGTTTGAWSTTEWFPILVKTSITLGSLPSAPGVASWIQADYVAARITSTVLDYHNVSPPSVVNLVHPKPTPFNSILTSISCALAEAGITPSCLPLQPFSEWFKTLENVTRNSPALNDLPGAKLLNFYRGLTLSSDSSPTSDSDECHGHPRLITSCWEELPPSIGASDVQKWVAFWQSKKLI